MAKVSLYTEQHVSIDFLTATLTQRILAYGIDLIILLPAIGILSLILGNIDPRLVPLVFVPFAVYTPLCEIFLHGQTLGKKAMRLRVINVMGKEPSALDYLIRWSFRLVDLYASAYAVAVIGISTSPRGQRLGGFLSNTMVVNLRSEMEISLTDILKIEDRDVYQPAYPEVYRLRESEMLTVKQTLEREAKYSGTAHSPLLQTCADKVAQVLMLDATPTDARAFLNRVLRDYIVLTRS